MHLSGWKFSDSKVKMEFTYVGIQDTSLYGKTSKKTSVIWVSG